MSFVGLHSVQPSFRFRGGAAPVKICLSTERKTGARHTLSFNRVICIVLFCGKCRIVSRTSFPNNVIGVACLYFATDSTN